MDRIEVIAEEISRLVPKLIKGMRRGVASDFQLTPSQMTVLLEVFDRKASRVGELSNSMRVSAPTVSGLIDRLVRSGYLRRIHDKKDRRVVNVVLTNKGKSTVVSLLSEIKKRWHKILTRLTEEERENYLRILKRIVEVLNKGNV